MVYQQTATSEQITLFSQETPTPTRRKGIPIVRIAMVKEGKLPCYNTRVHSSAVAHEILRTYLDDVDREYFLVIMLDRKNHALAVNVVSIGSLTGSLAHPRETFKAAILSNAAAIICGHNHPSGDPQPSQEDRVLTKRLKEAGDLLGINLLDHVVLGCEGRYFSFADAGIL
jgi:DNA repair protein RadC